MRYEFHPAALEEYDKAVLWYAEREFKLAIRFSPLRMQSGVFSRLRLDGQ